VNTERFSAVSKYLSARFQSGTRAALTDGELLERFASRLGGHDETVKLAFATLLARHEPMVLRVCRTVLGDRDEVEDAFQATFLILAVQARLFEGMTHEIAAAHLGWPVGSVHSRLAWARVRLRVRLARPGLAPDGVPFDRSGPATDPEAATSPYIVPASLAAAATRGALIAGRGEGALAGIASAEAVALMEGVVESMSTVKLMRIAAAVVLAGLITAGAGVLAYSPPRPHDPLLAIAPQDHVP
jgi:Sigma-70 region 2